MGPLRTLALGFCLGALAFAAPKRLEAGERVPDVAVESLDGDALSLATSTADDAPVSVIVFIDADQEATRRVLADLTTIQDALGADGNGKPPRSVRWIAVASGELAEAEATALADIANAHKYLRVGTDPERTAYAAFGVVAVPTTFVVGIDGVVAAAFPGRSAAFRARLDRAVRVARGEVVPEETVTVAESDQDKRVRRLVAAAHNLTSRRRHAEAADTLAEACALRPDDAELATELGNVQLDLLQGDEALAAFERALTIDPTLRSAQQGRACALALGDDTDAAKAALNDALKKPPRAARLYYFLGLVLERTGEAREAAAAFRQAYEIVHERGE